MLSISRGLDNVVLMESLRLNDIGFIIDQGTISKGYRIHSLRIGSSDIAAAIVR